MSLLAISDGEFVQWSCIVVLYIFYCILAIGGDKHD